jgi:hypothetical protein
MMDFEAWEQGVVRIGEARRALGRRLFELDEIGVSVLVDGEGVVQATIGLVDLRAGRAGYHRRFACPSCGRGVELLRWYSHQGFLCARCQPHRTHRQKKNGTEWWRREGGEQLDALVRVALKPTAARRIERMTALVEELIQIDQERMADLSWIATGRRL